MVRLAQYRVTLCPELIHLGLLSGALGAQLACGAGKDVGTVLVVPRTRVHDLVLD